MKKLLLQVVIALVANFTYAQWQTGGPTGQIISSLATSGASIYAGSDGAVGGVFYSANNGGSWAALDSIALQTTYVLSLATTGSNIFAGTSNGIFLSTDGGATWIARDTGLAANSRVNAIAANGPNIFAGTQANGVYLSIDNGSMWTEVNSGLTDTEITAIAINGSSIFAGTYGGGMFFSADDGSNWAAVNTGLTDPHVLAIATSGNNIYVATQSGSVFFSNNNGTSWTSVFSIEFQATSLAIAGGDIFVGTYGGGVYLSSNGGSWNATNTGLGNKYVNALAIIDTTIFAGTFEGGVWQMPITTGSGTCAAPAAPGNTTAPSSQKVCSGNSTTLTASGTGTISWYSAATGGMYLQAEDTFVTPVLDTTTTFYVQDSTCATSSRTAITVTVNPRPNAFITYLNDHYDTLTTSTFTSYQWLYNGVAVDSATNQFFLLRGFGAYQVAITDTNGCADTSAMFVYAGGIPAVNALNNIHLYPNPSTGSLQLTVDNSLLGNAIEIYDEEGRLVFQSEIKNLKSKIDLDVTKGIYFYRVTGSDTIIHQGKLVIE